MEKIIKNCIALHTQGNAKKEIEIKDTKTLRTDLDDLNIRYQLSITHYQKDGKIYEDRFFIFYPEDQERFLKFIIEFMYND